MSGTHTPRLLWGKRIDEIDIWKKPGLERPSPYCGGRLFPPHPDPTADEAVANVMREERKAKKRRLLRIIAEEHEAGQKWKRNKGEEAGGLCRTGEETDA